MAFEWWDSFDGTTTLSQDYTNVSGSVSVSAVGRNSTNGMSAPQGDTAYASKTLGGNFTTIVVGFAGRLQAAFNTTVPLIQLLDGGTLHVDLRIDTANRLFFTRNGTTIGAVSTNALVVGVYVYIEIKVTIDDTTGSIELRVNESSSGWVPATGSLDTRNGAAAQVNVVRIGAITGTSGPGIFRFDDYVVISTTGDAPTDFLGDVRIEGEEPNADGSPVDWTASAGSDFQTVDDNPPNDDTDYISSSTATQRSVFTFPNMVTTSGTVHGVGIKLRHRKDDAGARSIAARVESGASAENGATITVGDTYASTKTMFNDNVDAGPGAWTIAAVNAAELGVELVS